MVQQAARSITGPSWHRQSVRHRHWPFNKICPRSRAAFPLNFLRGYEKVQRHVGGPVTLLFAAGGCPGDSFPSPPLTAKKKGVVAGLCMYSCMTLTAVNGSHHRQDGAYGVPKNSFTTIYLHELFSTDKLKKKLKRSSGKRSLHGEAGSSGVPDNPATTDQLSDDPGTRQKSHAFRNDVVSHEALYPLD